MSESMKFRCEVERIELDMDQVRMLSCHHTFCTDCLHLQIEDAVNSDDTYMKLKCTMKGCNGFIDRHIVKRNFPGLFKQYSAKMNLHLLVSKLGPGEKLL